MSGWDGDGARVLCACDPCLLSSPRLGARKKGTSIPSSLIPKKMPLACQGGEGLMHSAVPAVAYCIDNNMLPLLLSLIDPATCSALMNLKATTPRNPQTL